VTYNGTAAGYRVLTLCATPGNPLVPSAQSITDFRTSPPKPSR